MKCGAAAATTKVSEVILHLISFTLKKEREVTNTHLLAAHINVRVCLFCVPTLE